VTTLKQGAKGDAVKQLQAAIGVNADGVFGPQTAAALKQWQQAHGLAADGVAGPKTWGAIQGGGGAPAAGGNGQTPGATSTPQPSADALKASFGFVGALAGAIPELKGVLDQAIREQWTSDRFIMAVSASNWYRTNADHAREFITLQQVDPATAQANWIRASGDMWTYAWQQGIKLDDKQAAEAAMWKINNPTATEDATRVHLARTYFNPYQDWNQLTGTAAQAARQIQEIGRNYGWDDWENYDSSRDTLGKIMRGELDVEGFQRQMLEQAKVKYPGLNDQLMAGATVKDLAQPYVDSYSKILEQPTTTINWYDDKLITEALQYRPDNGGNGGKGVESNGVMPIYQFNQKLREDPRWRKTDNAIASTGDLVSQIGKDFGFIGT
jgi:hypothetical protein